MKTLLLALEFPPAVGGVETYYANLAAHWPDELGIVDNHEAKLVSRRSLPRWLPALKTILTAARDNKPDWMLIGEILPLGTAAWLASYLAPVRYAVFLHGLDYEMATRTAWKRFLSKRILNKAGLVFCVNSHTAERVAVFTGEREKIRIMNPGATPLPTARPELVTGLRNNYGLEERVVLLTLGRLVKRKGADMVLKALPEVLKVRPDVRYIIAGRGPEEQPLKQLIAELGLGDKVTLLTEVSDEQRWAWLELCDIFIMPARQIGNDYEGFGIVYLEANLIAKPVIAGASGGVGDAVIDGLNGLLVDGTSQSAVSEAILRLVEDNDLRQRLGQQGKKRAEEEFNWKERVKEMHNALIKAL